MKLKKSLPGIVLSFSIFVLVTLVAISLTLFHGSVVSRIQKIAIQNMSEAQGLYKQSVQSKFTDLFDMLESQGRFFKGVDLTNDEDLKKTILTTHGIGEFKKIAVANKKGICIDYKGQPLANVSNKDFFTNTFMTGSPQISNRIELDENLEPILTLSYPLKNRKKAEAMLLGTLSYSVLKNLFSTTVFGGQSYSYIIARDGNVILCNNQKRKTLYNVNFYNYIQNENIEVGNQLEKMKTDISKNCKGFIIYDGAEGEDIFIYEPLGINNWYIVSTVPYSYIQNQRRTIEAPVFIIAAIISFAILSFVFAVFILFKTNTTIEKDNERLTIANTQTQSLIFEYDLSKGTVDFSGDTKFILGTDKKNFSIEFIRREYYKRVHPDDESVFKNLRENIVTSMTDFSSEFRYKSFGNEFIWVRMTGSTISKSNGETEKFIGTINNVNAQILHEQELKSIAESDKLTGLMNKSTMEGKIRSFTQNDLESRIGVLFVIDLDNFKMVNDTLGHLVGDQAIKDAAKKLSLIFSEKDYISRFGGDEFCILLRLDKNLPSETAQRIINEKAQAICSMIYETYSDFKNSVTITASIGISMYPENGDTYEELFEKADEALYQVKQSGKNNYRLAVTI